MTPTPEQNAKRVIELSENVSVLSTTETNAVILAKAYLAIETELQQLRLAADGMRDALVGSQTALNNFYEVGAAENESDQQEADRRMALVKEWAAKRAAALAAYRAAGEGKRQGLPNQG